MVRRGYTLFEILLVLTVLAVIAGIAWPAVLRFSNEQAIKDAGERVRSELDRTRFRAIDAGLTYQFRYEPNGTHYIAMPAEKQRVLAGGVGGTAPSETGVAGKLAEGLTFSGGPGVIPAGQAIGIEWFEGVAGGMSLQRVQWSAPILYRPDGTAEEAAFRIVDEKQRYVELSVRSLTGMAKASPLGQETTPWD